jgi:hypothetical protein
LTERGAVTEDGAKPSEEQAARHQREGGDEERPLAHRYLSSVALFAS